MSNDLAVKVCLLRLKRAIEEERCLFVERDKNIQALLDLNLSLDAVYTELLRMTPAGYLAGPEEDDDGTEGQVWIFDHPIAGTPVYVKLKFFSVGEQDWVKILSFHP